MKQKPAVFLLTGFFVNYSPPLIIICTLLKLHPAFYKHIPGLYYCWKHKFSYLNYFGISGIVVLTCKQAENVFAIAFVLISDLIQDLELMIFLIPI